MFASLILSLFGICSSSVTIANGRPENELPPDKAITGRVMSQCEMAEWSLASFSEKVVLAPGGCPMVPQRQIRVGSVSGVEVAVILISHEGLGNWFFSDLAMLSRVVY